MQLRMPVLTEADVSLQIRDFMAAKGWRPVRHQRTVMPGQFQAGEPGQADYQFIYYLRVKKCLALTLTLWVEFKKKGSKARCSCLEFSGTKKRCTACDQKNWREREIARGGIVWTGVNDFEWFCDTYQVYFGWLHYGEAARGQLELLAQIPDGIPC